MAVLLVLGVMNLGAMAVIAVLVNVERLTPGNRRVARAVGIIVIVAGLLVMLRAATLA
jgi:predicted metal-binding membrane protein